MFFLQLHTSLTALTLNGISKNNSQIYNRYQEVNSILFFSGDITLDDIWIL